MTPNERRIADARERLRAALVAGEPTEALRESIARMESDAQAAADRKAADDAEIEAERNEAIARRGAELLDQANARLSDALAPFQIPEEFFA